MMALFDFYGFPTDPNDMRALNETEIKEIQYTNFAAMQNANQSQANILGAADAFRPADKPLGERFLDFKRRLADAIERRKISH